MSKQRRLMHRGLRIVPYVLLVVLMLAGTVWSIAAAPPVSAHQFTLTGLADCGQKSGAHCRDHTAIGLLTDDSGARKLYRLNFDWIPGKDLPGLDQDDLIEVEVEVMADGQLRVLRLIDLNDRDEEVRKDNDQQKENSSGGSTTTSTSTVTQTVVTSSTEFATFFVTSTCPPTGFSADPFQNSAVIKLNGTAITVTTTTTTTITSTVTVFTFSTIIPPFCTPT